MKIEHTKAPHGFRFLISQKDAKSIFTQTLTNIDHFRLKFVHKTKGVPPEIQYLATYDYSALETQVLIWAVPEENEIAPSGDKIISSICNQIKKHIQNVNSQNQSGYIAMVNNEVYSLSKLNTFGLPSKKEWEQAVRSGNAKQLK